MSRKIDLSKPLSDEDRGYLEMRGRYWDIQMNDQQFKSVATAPADDDRVSESDVMDLKVDELREELSARGLSDDGVKDELRDRLLADLREKGELKES